MATEFDEDVPYLDKLWDRRKEDILIKLVNVLKQVSFKSLLDSLMRFLDRMVNVFHLSDQCLHSKSLIASGR